MAAGLRSTWSELAHDACQPFCPVTWAKCTSRMGQTQDVDFFGSFGNHQIDGDQFDTENMLQRTRILPEDLSLA